MKKYLYFSLILSATAIFGCRKVYNPPNNPTVVLSGPLARFEIVGNDMYVLTGNHLNVYDVSNPKSPRLIGLINPNGTIFSIRNYKDSLLLIGVKDAPGFYYVAISNPTYFYAGYVIPNSRIYDSFSYDKKYIYLAEHQNDG